MGSRALFSRSGKKCDGSCSDRVQRTAAVTELESNDASRSGAYLFFSIMFAVGFTLTFLLTFAWLSAWAVVVSILVCALLSVSIRIAPQWERVAVLKLGKFDRIAGPGVYTCVPFVESVALHVDQRIKTASFAAEAALTADLVPVDVDAILFWMVWDPEKACLAAENYPKAVLSSAQTAMRSLPGYWDRPGLLLRPAQRASSRKRETRASAFDRILSTW